MKKIILLSLLLLSLIGVNAQNMIVRCKKDCNQVPACNQCYNLEIQTFGANLVQAVKINGSTLTFTSPILTDGSSLASQIAELETFLAGLGFPLGTYTMTVDNGNIVEGFMLKIESSNCSVPIITSISADVLMVNSGESSSWVVNGVLGSEFAISPVSYGVYTFNYAANTSGAVCGSMPIVINPCSNTLSFISGDYSLTWQLTNNEFLLQFGWQLIDYAYSINYGDGSPLATGNVTSGTSPVMESHIFGNGTFTPIITLTNSNGIVSTITSPPLLFSGGNLTNSFYYDASSANTGSSVVITSQANCNIGEITVSTDFIASWSETFTMAGVGQPYMNSVNWSMKWNGVVVGSGTEALPIASFIHSFVTTNILPVNTIEIVYTDNGINIGAPLGTMTMQVFTNP